jgi:hypothetical protein
VNQSKISSGIAAAVITLASATASAVPLYDVFGPLDEATFGGTGIPNQEVAVSRQIEDGDTTITLGLSATQRFSNPALTNDGAGTYFANAGSNFGGAGQSTTEGALWNFNYYVDIDGPDGAKLTDYDITLFYDFDPAFDNGPIGLGQINLTAAVLGSDPSLTRIEGSQNLMFNFLTVDLPGLVTTPGFSAFDPNVNGEYNFALQVTRAGWSVEAARMDVQVVPVPAAVWLFVSALGLLGFRRKAI